MPAHYYGIPFAPGEGIPTSNPSPHIPGPMTRIHRTLLCSILVAASFACQARAQGFLHASGQTIRDGEGKEILLRGMGLGGWLVPEGYMLQTSGFANSPTEINAVIVDLVGQANADEFWRRYRANYVAKRDIDSLAAWGFNSIRLPMHYNLLTPKDQPGVYLESGFAYIDSLLAWCKANRLYLILDLHCAPGGQNSGNISDYIPGEPSLWESESNRQRTVDLWQTLAARYASEEWIGGYDLINETAWDLGAGNVPLRDLMIRITNAIRAVDTNHIVFIEGNWYATDFNGLAPKWDNNMVYSFHKYWNSNDFSSIGYLLSLRNSQNVPLWLGESGENSNHWFAECIALVEANNIGWAWWPHKKIESIAGPLSSRKTPGYDYLLRYWSGQVSRPTESFAVDALFGQAENLKIEKCIYQHDVIDAVLRLPTDTRRLPYAHNAIPGTVFASNFDMGMNGFAYRDADFQNLGNSSYNSGWSYRNDGVDIEKCSDFLSNGFNVGWTAASEFLTYTVDVATPGTYHLGLRVAAEQAGGSALLRWDGAVMMPLLSIPATGGWRSWVTVNAGLFTTTAGTHDFRMDLVAAGFNIASMIFSLVTAADDPGAGLPLAFSLGQNHPNPFNPETTIDFQLPASGPVKLSVYDLLGREVSALVDEEMERGNHSVRFDARRIASGAYLYRLTAGAFTQTRTMLLMK